MKYWPLRKYSIEIPYGSSRFKEMITIELSNNRKNEKSFFKTSKTTFKGQVGNGNFELYRRGFGNVTMIPNVKGHIIDALDDKSSIIELRINYNTITKVFLALWFSLVTIVFLLSLINALLYWRFNIGIPVSIGMFLIAYGMVMLIFSEEVKTIKRFFYSKWYIRIN